MEFTSSTGIVPLDQSDGPSEPSDSDGASNKSCESRNDSDRADRAKKAAAIMAQAVGRLKVLSRKGPEEKTGRRLRDELTGQVQDSGESNPERPSIPERMASVPPVATAVKIYSDSARLRDARRPVALETEIDTAPEAFPSVVITSPGGSERPSSSLQDRLRVKRIDQISNVVKPRGKSEERQDAPRPQAVATPTSSVRRAICEGMASLHRCPHNAVGQTQRESVTSPSPHGVHIPFNSPTTPHMRGRSVTSPADNIRHNETGNGTSFFNRRLSSSPPAVPNPRKEKQRSGLRNLARRFLAKLRLGVIFERIKNRMRREKGPKPSEERLEGS